MLTPSVIGRSHAVLSSIRSLFADDWRNGEPAPVPIDNPTHSSPQACPRRADMCGEAGEDSSVRRRRSPVNLTDLSSVLWRARELLELLLFKLEEEQLLLASNRSRWLAH